MGLDLGQSVQGDLADQLFEPLVFSNPCLNLREQVRGNVDGAGFALLFAGQIMGWMAWTGGAMTAWSAAFAVDGDEAGGQDRSPGLELFDPGLELASDEGGMVGDFHERKEAGVVCMSEMSYYLSDNQEKKAFAKTFLRGDGGIGGDGPATAG
jgi:hypothetical protein